MAATYFRRDFGSVAEDRVAFIVLADFEAGVVRIGRAGEAPSSEFAAADRAEAREIFAGLQDGLLTDGYEIVDTCSDDIALLPDAVVLRDLHEAQVSQAECEAEARNEMAVYGDAWVGAAHDLHRGRQHIAAIEAEAARRGLEVA